MSIPFSESITNVAFDITYQCNLRCIHCFNSSGEHNYDRDLLTDDKIYEISKEIAEIKTLQSMCFCGGEPLLKRDAMFKSSKLITSEIDDVMVNFVTNAFILNDEIIKDIKKSGIYMVQVSLDGFSSSVHNWIRNNPNSYEKAISAIKLLRMNNINVSVATLPTKKSVNELDELIELLDSLGVSDFRMQPLMILGRAKDNLRNDMLNDYDYRNLARKLLKLKSSRIFTNKMKIEWGDPILHLRNFSNKDLAYLYINAYGELMLSPYLPIVVGDLRKYTLREYFQAGLKDIWKEKDIVNLASKILSCDTMDLNEHGNIPEIFTKERYVFDICENQKICI